MICSRCSTALPDTAKFCLECGKYVAHICHKFAIANQEGRVGKTTTAVNLGAYLSNAGRKTLIVDVCPNARATTSLGVNLHHLSTSMYEVLVTDTTLAASVIKADILPGLSLLPANVDLWASDLDLPFLENRERRLQRALEPIRDQYDYILLDCPSWLGLLTINALTAADGVILPLQCEYFALEGFQQLLKTIKLVRDQLNPAVALFGMVITMYEPRTRLSNEIVKEIQDHFPREKFNEIIPHDVRLAQALSFGVTILQHDPRSPGALAYKDLAEEVIARAETYITRAVSEPALQEAEG
jgi:chromosome partitioning protein